MLVGVVNKGDVGTKASFAVHISDTIFRHDIQTRYSDKSLSYDIQTPQTRYSDKSLSLVKGTVRVAVHRSRGLVSLRCPAVR